MIRAMRIGHFLSVSVLLLFCARVSAAESVSYNRDIRPILAANCFDCHGPDEGHRKAKLRLDDPESAFRDRDGMQAIAPGHPEASESVRRLLTKDADDVMPPPKTGRTLTRQQIDLVRRWIGEGARYEKHWAFTPITRPQPPEPPAGMEVPQAIDRFVLARLQREGLKPAPSADPYALLRRVSLDLTGLPPTVEEADRFAADPSPAAYEQVVDRLLASPRFGEHWARMWMDLARYADTKGYEKDQPRTIWRYRDWLIDAFNTDMPLDRFTTEQLAGDLLPDAMPAQRLATAFHRNTMCNDEGGTDDEEFRVTAVKDRVDTTVQVWMGLTMGCAKCHSHKYDPISHADYYRFYALFNQTADHDRPDDTPTEEMPTAEQSARLATAEARLKTLRADYERPRPELDAERAKWEAELAVASSWFPLVPSRAVSAKGAELGIQSNGAVLVNGTHPETDLFTLALEAPATGGSLTALRLEALTHAALPQQGPGRHKPDPNFVVSELRVKRAGDAGAPVRLQKARADYAQDNWPADAAFDGKGDTGWAISPQKGKPHALVVEFAEPVPAGTRLVIEIEQNYAKLQLGHFRISANREPPASLGPTNFVLAAFAAKSRDARSADEQKQLDDAFRAQHPATKELSRQVAEAAKTVDAARASLPRIPVMKELAAGKQRTTKIHQRGNFLDPGDEVKPAVLEAFGPMPAGAPTNRLGVAQWIMAPENPLTARVMANRFWARFFGVGLVESEEDFGLQGMNPTHPDLLDWLAVELRDTDRWSVKKFCRTIVLSATYRQSSRVEARKLKIDPRNLLLSRGPRFRLSAESVRDQALAASGLLSGKIGGPSVMPPQPPGIWKAAYSSLKWESPEGEDRFRRGLYTFLRRTSPYPALTTFDAGSGELCTIRRIRTNTPLQALVTLNDPAFVEAAGALALRMADLAENRRDDAIAHGFRRLLLRAPAKTELSQLGDLYERMQKDYRAKPEEARALLASARVAATSVDGEPRLAALITVANVLLNLDEAMTKP